MKRPRTRPFSSLWKFNAEDMASSQARPTVRRRRGRPPGKPTLARFERALKLVAQLWAQGATMADIAVAVEQRFGLDPGSLPESVVREYVASELG